MGNLCGAGLHERTRQRASSDNEPQTKLLSNPQVTIAKDRATFTTSLGIVYDGTVGFANPASFVKTRQEAPYFSKLNHPNIALLFFDMTIDTKSYLVFEYLAAPLSEFIPSLNENYKEILQQLADGVEYLHERGIACFALEPENVCVVGVDERYVVKLFAFSDAIASENDTPFSAQNKFKDISALGSLFSNIFSKGSVTKELPIYSIDHILHTKTDSPNYSDYLCADLIHNMKLQLSEPLEASEVRSHPLFWEDSQIVRFFIEISKLIEKEKKNQDKVFVNHLSSISKNTLGDSNWIFSIDSVVLSELEDARKDFHDRNGGTAQNLGGNIVSLLMAMRNITVHHQHSEVIAELMGTDTLFVNFWLGQFPRLFREVYKVKMDFEEGKPVPRKPKIPRAAIRMRRNR